MKKEDYLKRIEEDGSLEKYYSEKGGRNDPFNNYVLLQKLGSGTYATVVGVEKRKQNQPSELIALKIIVDDIGEKNDGSIELDDIFYKEESNAFLLVQEEIVDKKLSPNFIYHSKEIIHIPFSDIIFPTKSKWYSVLFSIYEHIKKIRSKTKNTNVQPQMHIIEMEWASVNNIKNFFSNEQYLSSKQLIREQMRSFIFQLISGLASLQITNVQHRDINISNMVIMKKKERIDQNDYKDEYRYFYGKQLFKIPLEYQRFTILFIDYSLTEKINDTDDYYISTTKTRLYSRAPELIFLTKDKILYYDTSDVFSTAISIIELIFSFSQDKRRIFYDFQNQLEYDTILQKLKKQKFNSTAQNFIKYQSEKSTITYVTSLFRELGIPTNNDYPNIEKTRLYKTIIDNIEEERKNRWMDGSLWNNKLLNDVLQKDGMDLLKKMLKWNPRERIQPLEALRTHPYFTRYRFQANKNGETNVFGAAVAKINNDAITLVSASGDSVLYRNIKLPKVSNKVIGERLIF